MRIQPTVQPSVTSAVSPEEDFLFEEEFFEVEEESNPVVSEDEPTAYESDNPEDSDEVDESDNPEDSDEDYEEDEDDEEFSDDPEIARFQEVSSDYHTKITAELEAVSGVGYTIPEEYITAINERYAAVSGRGNKAAARKWAEDNFSTALQNGEYFPGVAWMLITKDLKAGSAASQMAAKRNTRQSAYAEHVAIHQVTGELLKKAATLAGLKADESDAESAEIAESNLADATVYLEWLMSPDKDKTPEPIASPVAAKAATNAVPPKRISHTRSGGARRPHGSAMTHLTEVASSLSEGEYLTAAEIAARPSSVYPEGCQTAQIEAAIKRLASSDIKMEVRGNVLGVVKDD